MGERAPAPVKDGVPDFSLGHVSGVDGVHAPVASQSLKPLPAHLLPPTVGDDVRHMQRIGCLSAHPFGERLVVDQERWVVAACREALGLRFGAGIQQAHGDRFEPGC